MSMPRMRIAFREEGKFWNAYAAQLGSMENAVLLGSIDALLVHRSKKLKDQFMALSQAAFLEMLVTMQWITPQEAENTTWPSPIKAPEHERTKQ